MDFQKLNLCHYQESKMSVNVIVVNHALLCCADMEF